MRDRARNAAHSFTALALMWIAASSAAVATPPVGQPDVCFCAEAREVNGWCTVHARGWVAAVPIRSKLLWEMLDAHGHQVDPATFLCDSCQRAIAEEGFCEEHRVGFVGKLAYFSRLTYELARGRRIAAERIDCPVCRHNAEFHGWCESCRRGLVGHVVMLDRASYEAAADALAILDLANAAAERCESCAIAIVTDADCPFCGIHYRDGHPVPEARANDEQP